MADSLNVADLKGKIDIAIISIREDEFEAVLQRFPMSSFAMGNRLYSICKLPLAQEKELWVAVVRCEEQGTTVAQDTTRDVIEDLDPNWLMLVGIAGAFPEKEFSMGDVVLATRLLDFSVEAALPEGEREFSTTGGPMHKKVQVLFAQVKAFRTLLQGWNSEEALTIQRPMLATDSSRFYGDKDWKKKVKESLEQNFPEGEPTRAPVFTALSVASSNNLVKSVELAKQWKNSSRHVSAVEMELSGVYQAARRVGKEYPILAIRGISDVIGFKREHNWLEFACHTAASFAYKLASTGVLGVVDKQPASEPPKATQPQVAPERDDYGPLRFDWDDLCEVISSIHDLVTPEENQSGNSSRYDFFTPGIKEKNEINGMGDDYFALTKQHYEPYFTSIEEFLKDDSNRHTRELYYDIVDELRQKITVSRSQFDCFEDVLLHLYDQTIKQSKASIKKKRRVLSLVLNFMYFNCDIGKKS